MAFLKWTYECTRVRPAAIVSKVFVKGLGVGRVSVSCYWNRRIGVLRFV